MKIYISGATGLLGQKLMQELQKRGHDTAAISRSPEAGMTWDQLDLHDADAVVHLAGAGVFDKRWNAGYKQILRESRIDTKQQLIDAMPKSAAFIQASAVGFYGLKPDGDCKEDRAAGTDFLAQLCADWESPVPNRHVAFRIGIVFSHEGGALEELRKLYRMRVGGKIAGGTQAFPWIHIDDVVAAFAWAVETDVSGVYNLAAPGIVDQAGLDRALGAAWKVCHLLPTPAFGLRIAAGEAGKVLAGGQWIDSSAIERAGFTFTHPKLRGALEAIEAARANA